MYSSNKNLAGNLSSKHESITDIESKKNSPSFIRAQLDKNVRDLRNKIISTKVFNESETIVITINLERATDDNFKVFNDYINHECEYNYKKFILDLSEALFLDSTFLGSIVIFYKKIKQLDKKFSLVLDKSKIKILQPFDNLEKMLNVRSSIEEALKL